MFHTPTTETKQQNHAGRSPLRPEPRRELSQPVPDTVRHGSSGAANYGASLAAPQQQVMRLHSMYGNQAVLRMLSHFAPAIQTKLTVNQPGDPFEQEADRVADQVMRMTALPSIQRKCSSCEGEEKVQRKCAECEEEEKKTELHRKETGSAPQFAPPSVHNVLNSPGQPLDPATCAFMEPRFGYDFSRVRIHTDASAAEAANIMSAHAFAAGEHLVFAAGQYQPGSAQGSRLLAHELAHVVQSQPHLARQPSDPAQVGQLQPHVPQAPAMPAPPIPKEEPAPSTCPSDADKATQIAAQGIPAKISTAIRLAISIGTARSSGGQTMRLTNALINQADAAIHAQFGSLLPSRSFSRGGTITRQTPDDFAKSRVPDQAVDAAAAATAARLRIRQFALSNSGDALRALCITSADDPVLESAVAVPVLADVGIDTVRNLQKTEIGGSTSFPTQANALPQVTLPTEGRNLGHIVVHEAMHFYVHEAYRQVAELNPQLKREMMEGGAEFMARLVINGQLAKDPNFQINYGAYSSEFSYVNSNLIRGGTFPTAYLQGRIDLLGLTSRANVHPKMKISQSGDPLEQETDRMADQIMRMAAPPSMRQQWPGGSRGLDGQPATIQRQPKQQPPPCPPASEPVRQLPADFNTPQNNQALAEIMWHEMRDHLPGATAVGSIVLNRLLKTKFHKVGQLLSFEREPDPSKSILDLACKLLTGQVADTTNGSENYFSPRSMPDEANVGCCTGQSGPCNIAKSKGKLDCKNGLQVVPGTDPPQKRFFPSFATPDKRQAQPEGTDPMLIQVYKP